jgi:hypothetical protein
VRPAFGTAITWLLIAATLAAGTWLWSLHARAWDLGGRSPVLGYEAAQVAVAARELAERGRLATWFALPIELVRHPRPPWPLAAIPPGPVLAGAAVEHLAPRTLRLPGGRVPLATPAKRSWLALTLPLACYLALGAWLALAGRALIARHAPELREPVRLAAAATLALVFLLDPEVQLAVAGGYPELPFAAGVVAIVTLVATGWAARRPFRFGLVLGAVACFRLGAPWFAACFVAATAWSAPAGARLRAMGLALGGFALLLAPWWIYQWTALGAPGADLSRWMVWDEVQGRTWFSMLHLPVDPVVPTGREAAGLIAEKIGRHLGGLALALATGPRALWIGALVVWLATRPARALAAAGAAVLALAVPDLIAAAATMPGTRPLLPSRVPLEAAGILATWALLHRIPEESLARGGRRLLDAAVMALALGWGTWQCGLGLAGARAASLDRGLPTAATIADLAARLDRELEPGEPVMTNLGPTLAYHARRPVVHLALGPAEVEPCRARLDFAHVVLAFREPARAWPEWRPVMEPGGEHGHPEWNVARVRRWRSADGFALVWIELGPVRPQLALVEGRVGGGRSPSGFGGSTRPVSGARPRAVPRPRRPPPPARGRHPTASRANPTSEASGRPRAIAALPTTPRGLARRAPRTPPGPGAGAGATRW